jgi:hypothetical protein
VATESPGGGAAQAAARTTPSPTPTFNLDDMMGFYPQQTVFIADVEKVTAVTLLNHFTRYVIPTRGIAEVAAEASTAASWLYVLDGMEAAAARIEGATVRLRAFDLQTGVERASRGDMGPAAGWQRALATSEDGRVLVLRADGKRAWIDAYERLTLKPLGMVMEKSGCGDRLLVSASRVAIVCLHTGEIAVAAPFGAGTAMVAAPIPGLAGVTMAQDGTIYAATVDRRLVTVGSRDTALVAIPWPSAWTGTVLTDGVAVAAGSPTLVIAQMDTDGAWLRTLSTNVQAPSDSLRLAGRTGGAPQTGVLALYPFAYFASGGTVRHVEIRSGMLETMTELGQGATIAAVVER